MTSFNVAIDHYESVHGLLSLAVCIIGVTMNVINIAVLSHRDMLSSINRLLQAIGRYAKLLTINLKSMVYGKCFKFYFGVYYECELVK